MFCLRRCVNYQARRLFWSRINDCINIGLSSASLLTANQCLFCGIKVALSGKVAGLRGVMIKKAEPV